jgi:hypothetical protein
MKRLASGSVLRIAGMAAGAAAVSGAVILMTASAAGLNVFNSSSPTSGISAVSSLQQAGQPSAVCSDFVSHFSADLGTSQATVGAAFQKAIGETLADQVKSGKVTQARADAIQKRLAGRAPCAIAGALGKAPLAGARQALLSAAASALGITDTALKTDLGQGMTLSQIAAAQAPPITEDQFRSRLITNLTPLLDKAVAAKMMTPAQETRIINRLRTGPIPLWSKPLRTATAAPMASTP